MPMTPAVSDLLREAETLRRSGRLADAIDRYDRAIAQAPKHLAIRQQRGLVLAQAGRHVPALADLDAALAERPGDAQLLGVRGICLMELGELGAAIMSYDAAITGAPDDFGLHYNRGTALKRLGDPVEAIASFDRAIACNPRIADAHNNRGAALEDLHRFDEALASYDRALALAPGNADAWTNRGNVLKALWRIAEAQESYTRAVMAAPYHPVALNMLGGLLLQLGYRAEAIACWDRLLGVAPDTPLIAGQRRHAKMHMAEWDGFDADIARIGEGPAAVLQDPLDQGRQISSSDLAQLVQRATGDDQTLSIEHLQSLSNRAILLRLLNNVSVRAERDGDFVRALEMHRRMTAIAPLFSGIWWERARLEQAMGHVRAARESLVAMAETTRNPTLTRQIRQALDELARSMN